MQALVLGATGHIGAHVVRALLADGHRVRAAYRNPRFLSLLEGLPVERVRVDLETLDGLREALHGCDWVFHAAGYYPGILEGAMRREDAVQQGTISTRRVCERLAEAAPARVVFTSSAATIRRVPGRAATEADAMAGRPAPPPELSLYATVKLAMEQEALRAHRGGLPVVLVNPSVCIGEYDAHKFSGRLVLVFAKHRLPVYVDHTLNAVYTGDVGAGHVLAAERGRCGERYLLANRDITVKEVADIVARAVGVAPPRWRLSPRLVRAAAGITEAWARVTRTEPLLPRAAVESLHSDQRLDAAKARRELGLPQTSIEEAIARAVEWFQAHGELPSPGKRTTMCCAR